ncbi:hypothetical protein EZS27_011651 [termite gut metagenome]|uniref:Uncharacterized protein n=1 Tax=termite gut metagenome TaxID=433724 RepID=A0A5J4S544_9ZZZZ
MNKPVAHLENRKKKLFGNMIIRFLFNLGVPPWVRLSATMLFGLKYTPKSIFASILMVYASVFR